MSEALFTLYESTGSRSRGDHPGDFTDASEGCDTKLSDASERNEAELSSGLPESEMGVKRMASPAAILGVPGRAGGLEPSREL